MMLASMHKVTVFTCVMILLSVLERKDHEKILVARMNDERTHTPATSEMHVYTGA